MLVWGSSLNGEGEEGERQGIQREVPAGLRWQVACRTTVLAGSTVIETTNRVYRFCPPSQLSASKGGVRCRQCLALLSLEEVSSHECDAEPKPNSEHSATDHATTAAEQWARRDRAAEEDGSSSSVDVRISTAGGLRCRQCGTMIPLDEVDSHECATPSATPQGEAAVPEGVVEVVSAAVVGVGSQSSDSAPESKPAVFYRLECLLRSSAPSSPPPPGLTEAASEEDGNADGSNRLEYTPHVVGKRFSEFVSVQKSLRLAGCQPLAPLPSKLLSSGASPLVRHSSNERKSEERRLGLQRWLDSAVTHHGSHPLLLRWLHTQSGSPPPRPPRERRGHSFDVMLSVSGEQVGAPSCLPANLPACL